MPKAIVTYVRLVEAVNYRVGRIAMYILYVMMGILIWSTVSKVTPWPSIWTLEMAQFAMVAFYMLGGPYSLQLDSNVRMDLLYHRWSPRTRAWVDAFSVFALLFYLCVLLYGAVESTAYSIGLSFEPTAVGWLGGAEIPLPHTGFMERAPTAWRPYLWPVKLTSCIAILLMLLQAIAHFFRDVATLRGEEI